LNPVLAATMQALIVFNTEGKWRCCRRKPRIFCFCLFLFCCYGCGAAAGNFRRRSLPHPLSKAEVMYSMNISLPDTLKAFVDVQVSQRGYSTSSEYVRELIRCDQDRLQLRDLLLAGAVSAPTAPVGESYFNGLRARVRKAGKSGVK
jgi:antitoxin ParD1/3/4